jgi:hypothetical protein
VTPVPGTCQDLAVIDKRFILRLSEDRWALSLPAPLADEQRAEFLLRSEVKALQNFDPVAVRHAINSHQR